MKVSLIITTYNWHQALELVLLTAQKQSLMPYEIIIADDGSGNETKVVIDQFKDKLPLKHLWHEDDGFRRTVILNKAIAQAQGEYIIQLDGDCLMHPDFVKDHTEMAVKNQYLYGSRVNIREEFLPELFQNKVTQIGFFNSGIKNKTRNLHLPFLMKMYKANDQLSSKLRGCNLSYWKKDILKINGYNEDMTGWGKEDSEMAIRLLNTGVKGRRIRYGGIIYHIFHTVKSKSRVNINESIQQKAIDENLTYCPNGIDKYL
ncbi:glycosyltransferase family 2 protein [Mesonia sp. K7]|uniref:glycosyltransferase family 2 protein n=1 Tax=Mesonia sp. K7 TaxID=2218606 RepID=UPI000DA8CEEA|nr:glycosyltransferase family 2 protein [Mesonia sp. K7]PZD78244.1 glycosyl transferase [Mesonia sp. K7]